MASSVAELFIDMSIRLSRLGWKFFFWKISGLSKCTVMLRIFINSLRHLMLSWNTRSKFEFGDSWVSHLVVYAGWVVLKEIQCWFFLTTRNINTYSLFHKYRLLPLGVLFECFVLENILEHFSSYPGGPGRPSNTSCDIFLPHGCSFRLLFLP